MFTNQFEDIGRSNSLYEILDIKDNPETLEQQEIRSLLKGRLTKIEDEIIKGDLYIFDPNSIKERVRALQKERLKKQKELHSPTLQSNDYAMKQLKREIIKLKQQEANLMKEEAKLKKKEVLEQIKKWEQIQAEIREKKSLQEAEKLRKQNQQAQKQRREQYEKQLKKRLQKKQQIQLKLKKIQQNKNKREEISKSAQVQYSQLHPKYVQMEKKYKQIEEQMKFEEDLTKRNNRISIKIDYNAIKAHERQYMSMVQERNQKRSSMKASSVSSVEERAVQFTTFFYRNEAKIEEERLKLKRRHEFEEKIKSMPLQTDDEIKLKFEIARDKGQNPFKYHFLGQKALADEQIYSQFPKFSMNLNPKSLGKEYLKELPGITQTSRILKSQSEYALSTRQQSERFKYKDYLSDLKMSRVPQREVNEEELIKASWGIKNKEKVLQQLADKEKKFSVQIQKRKQQLQQYNGIKLSLKKIKQIDEMYAKSINTKLARIEINK